MLLVKSAKSLVLLLVIARHSFAVPWRSTFEDDVTGLNIDDDEYQEGNSLEEWEQHSGHDVVEEKPLSAFEKALRLFRRQSSNPADGTGRPTLPSQNINATNPQGPDPGNSTTGIPPGLIKPQDNPNNDKVNCSDLVTGRANDCWAQLSLTEYVNDWVETHECYEGEGFSTCYLRQNGFPSLDCSVITVSSCPPPQSDSVILDPQKFYVAYNIHAINAFFYSWWLAVGNSGGIAVDNLGKIVQIINPPSSLQLKVQKILIAFQSVFALAPGISGVWAAKTDKSYAYQIGAQSISNALATSPNIGRFFFPTDTADGKVIQIAELSASFASILQQVQSNLNQTLVSVMQNHTEFLAFAEQGNFSSKPQPLSDQSNYLYYAFNTYLISSALSSSNINAVIGKGTSPVELATNGTTLAYPLDDCKKGYNEQGVCDAWWYSNNYKSAFTLDNFSHMDRNYGDQLTSLFANLTSGELLFEGAYACNSQGYFGGPVNITVTSAGVNTACISQLKVLTWDMRCHDQDEKGGSGPNPECEFLEVPAQPTFWYNNLHTLSSKPQFSVPYGYLGPAITRHDKFPLRRT